MRLIDANECPALFDAKFKETKRLILEGENHLDNLAEGFMEAHNVIRSMPTIDAAPVVHGCWIDKGWDGDFSWRIDGHGNCWRVISCSVCGGNLCGSEKTAYCPHCGAKMDLPEDGE